jgi:hypothetical protein
MECRKTSSCFNLNFEHFFLKKSPQTIDLEAFHFIMESYFNLNATLLLISEDEDPIEASKSPGSATQLCLSGSK